ncbi:polyprotein [Phytophthora megakarya]|uniref:Polyprotein n=1 Tax=Phytophthora megakarya TaxID=4795 RepID=A0A225W6L8_9STRA|nr:polyprotein [Phytophthora megakarya]
MKALGLMTKGLSVNHHTKVRQVTSTMQTRSTLLEFYNRTAITRRLHDFKMEDGSTMARHLNKFDQLIVGLQTVGEPLDNSRQLVMMLSSLPTEFKLIASIVENSKDVTLIEVK